MHHETRTRRPWFVACFLTAAGAMAATAAAVGINDNPTGVFLCWGAVACAVLAFAHPWRRDRPYFLLLGWSFVTFVAGVILHNLFWGIAHAHPELPGWIHAVLEALHVGAFLVAVMLCPPAIAVGLMGWLVCLAGRLWRKVLRRRRGTKP